MTILHGSCHCGSVTFEVHAAPRGARRCNCSICRRKGAIMLTASEAEFKLLSGADNLGLYQWNTKTARHYFCKTCGIYTHHWRRSAPEFGYNSGCIDDLDPAATEECYTNDGQKMSSVSPAEQDNN